MRPKFLSLLLAALFVVTGCGNGSPDPADPDRGSESKPADEGEPLDSDPPAAKTVEPNEDGCLTVATVETETGLDLEVQVSPFGLNKHCIYLYPSTMMPVVELVVASPDSDNEPRWPQGGPPPEALTLGAEYEATPVVRGGEDLILYPSVDPNWKCLALARTSEDTIAQVMASNDSDFSLKAESCRVAENLARRAADLPVPHEGD